MVSCVVPATALQRELRDKRFDMPVARAIADGKPLTPEQIDRFTSQYHDNWLRLRATTVARTEALHAANMGGRLAIEQTVEDGGTSGFDVERTWIATNDARIRDSHRELKGCSNPYRHNGTQSFQKPSFLTGAAGEGQEQPVAWTGGLSKTLPEPNFSK